MTITIVHPFASAKSDGADATQVQPSNWNAQHTLTLATARLLGRKTAGTGQVEEIDPTNSSDRTGVGLGALAAKTTIATADIDASTSYSTGVTYPKLQKIKASCLMGNPVSTSLTPQDVTVGAGLVFSGITVTGAANNGSGLIRLAVSSSSTLTTGDRENVAGVVGTTEANGAWTITVIDGTHIDLQASAFVNAYVSGGTVGASINAPGNAPPGVFKNLVIKVATNTTISVSADSVALTNGTNFLTTGTSSTTIDMSGSVAINKLDIGGIAAATWYYIWQVAKADGTVGWLASLQSTANATFLSNLAAIASGAYTYYARVGAVTTAAGSAQLMGTYQFGRRATYVLGLAQTTVVPVLASGANGTTITPTWVQKSIAGGASGSALLTPSTTTVVYFQVTTAATTSIAVAPSASYGAGNSTTIPPPISITPPTSNVPYAGQIVLEAATVQIAGVNAACIWFVTGWEDGI